MPRKTKQGKRQNNNDGDVTEANILPVAGRRSATKKARTEVQEEEFEKEIDDLAEVLAIVENVDLQFDEMAEEKQEVEEEQREEEKSEDPPSNQEQNELIKERERETRKAAAQSLGKEMEDFIEEDEEIEIEEDDEPERVSEGFEEKMQRIYTVNEEYAFLLQKGDLLVPNDMHDIRKFSLQDLAHMIMFYMNRLHFYPDTFQAFYCPDNDMVPWVGRPKYSKNWNYYTFRTYFSVLTMELASMILGQ